MNKRIAIVGSRSFLNYNFLKEKINDYKDKNSLSNITIVSGGAVGADKLSEQYAKEYNHEMVVFEPKWKEYGKSAGMIRNKEIIKNSDIVIAFWDSKSKGTKNSIDLAKKNKKDLIIFKI